MNPYRYLILFVLPITVVIGYHAGGYYSFLTPILCFVLLPIIDLVPVKKNPQARSTRYHHQAFRLIPFLFVPAVLLLVFGGSILMSIKSEPFQMFLGVMISVGVVNGTIGFALAHEFIHKFSVAPKVAGYLLLLSTGYLHYSIEHVHGHHVYACTPIDPNSAKRGESFYKFFVRSLIGSFLNAWKIELRHLTKINRPFLSVRNRMLMFMLVQSTALIILGFAFGTKALLFFIGQALVAIILHQQVNYLQHYGLTRSDNGSAREKMHAHHSWSIPGNCRIVDLFQVQNHADHHIHASTPYEKLVAIDESPKLPANYATMILLTLIPPLWFKIMHKRLPSSL